MAFRFSGSDCKRLEFIDLEFNPSSSSRSYVSRRLEPPIPLKELHDLKWVLKPAKGVASVRPIVRRLVLAGETEAVSKRLYEDFWVTPVAAQDGTYTMQSSRSSLRVQEDLVPSETSVSVQTQRLFAKISDSSQFRSLLNRRHTILSKNDRLELKLSKAHVDLKSKTVTLGGSSTTFLEGQVKLKSASVSVSELGSGLSRSGSRVGPFVVQVGERLVFSLGLNSELEADFFPIE